MWHIIHESYQLFGNRVNIDQYFFNLSSTVISFFFKFYFIFKLYITVLVLPNIKMNRLFIYLPWSMYYSSQITHNCSNMFLFFYPVLKIIYIFCPKLAIGLLLLLFFTLFLLRPISLRVSNL